MNNERQDVPRCAIEVPMSRVTIKELRLRNYRAFADARLILDDVTFLVGRNGAGKSTLMDAFSFVSEAVTDSLNTALERRGGFLSLLPKHVRANGSRQGISVAICFERQDESPILYGFRVGMGYAVEQEILRGDQVPSFERDGKGFRSSIASLQPEFDPETLALPLIAGSNKTWKTVIESLRLISVHQFSPQAIRSEPKIGNERRLSRDGHNAADILKHIKPRDKKWIETWLAAAVPGFKDVSTDIHVGRRAFVFAQAGNLFDASQMSDGTLRSLGILLALRQSPRPSIVVIDEIEDSLHPHAHGVLLDAIEEASEEFPVVVSTHNPEILSHPSARGERVRVIQWNEGVSRIYHLGEGVRANLEPPLTVGQLLRANALWTEAEPSIIGDEADFFELP
jgi:predicted ATPase